MTSECVKYKFILQVGKRRTAFWHKVLDILKSFPVLEINRQLLGMRTNATEEKIRDCRVVPELLVCLLQRERNVHDIHRLS